MTEELLLWGYDELMERKTDEMLGMSFKRGMLSSSIVISFCVMMLMVFFEKYAFVIVFREYVTCGHKVTFFFHREHCWRCYQRLREKLTLLEPVHWNFAPSTKCMYVYVCKVARVLLNPWNVSMCMYIYMLSGWSLPIGACFIHQVCVIVCQLYTIADPTSFLGSPNIWMLFS